MGSQIFRERLQGLKSLDWKVNYTIEMLLEFRCVKCACTSHLNILNTNYGQKEGRESKCQFDSQPLKVKNRPDLLACRWCATYCWKAFNEGYNFALDLTSIRGLQKTLWAFKVMGDVISGISGLPIWEFWEKMTFGCKPHGQAWRIL
jgi:hypothetical protein